MKIINKIDVKTAAKIMVVMMSCGVFFHLLVLTGAIPYSIVWGGRLETLSQMYVFETVALTINLLIVAVTGIKAGYIKSFLKDTLVRAILWVLVILFSLNTIGNILSLSILEAVLFTPVTFLAAVLCYRMAIEK